MRSVLVRYAMRRGAYAGIFRTDAHLFVMSFYRIKIVKKNGKTYSYLVRQTNVRKGKKVYSIMEHIGGFIIAAASPGRSGFSNRSTDKRQMRDQEQADRELFNKDRGAFNVKQRQDYEREQKARTYGKETRDAKMSRTERRERAEATEAADKKAEETMEAVREFNEARAGEGEK